MGQKSLNMLFIKTHFKNSRSLTFSSELNSKQEGTNWKLFSSVRFVFVIRKILTYINIFTRDSLNLIFFSQNNRMENIRMMEESLFNISL